MHGASGRARIRKKSTRRKGLASCGVVMREVQRGGGELTCSLPVSSRPARPSTRLVTSTSGSRRHRSGDSGFATVLDRRRAFLGGEIDDEPQHGLVRSRFGSGGGGGDAEAIAQVETTREKVRGAAGE